MEDKNKLIELLQDMIEIAKSQNNELSKEEINAYLKDLSFEEAQLEPIYDYLIANKISVKGYKNKIKSAIVETKNDVQQDNNSDSKERMNQDDVKDEEIDEDKEIDKIKIESKEDKEEKEFLKMYLQDLDFIRPSSKEEEQLLITKLLQEDDSAKNRLVEINLKKVVDLANTFKGKGMILSDLIQEGNIGLINAVDAYKENCKHGKEVIDFDTFVQDSIRVALSNIINELIETKHLDKRIIEKVSNLTDSLKELTEDLGKKPTIKEASTYLKMSVEEIQDIIRLSKDDDIPIERHHDHSHDHQDE